MTRKGSWIRCHPNSSTDLITIPSAALFRGGAATAAAVVTMITIIIPIIESGARRDTARKDPFISLGYAQGIGEGQR